MINEKMVGFPAAYVVNLEEMTDRREYMETEFGKLGVTNYHIMSYPRIENSDIKIIAGPECDALPVGATSSHLLTIKHWLETTDEDMCAIFEDDCDFSVVDKWQFNFSDYIKKFGALWDCLQLCIIHEGYPVMYPRGRVGWDHGLQCYIIKRGYAQKLVDYWFKDDRTIHFRMPKTYSAIEESLRQHAFREAKMRPTIENVIYGIGKVYTHPIFNHNVPKFQTTIHTNPETLAVSDKSYHYVKDWWERKGQHATLEQLFTYEWACPPGQVYGYVTHIDL